MPDTQTLDKDEIQALFFDLVRADRTTEVKQLLVHFQAMSQDLQEEVLHIVSEVGSGVMMDVLCKAGVTSELKVEFAKYLWFDSLHFAARSKNLDVVQWVLRNTDVRSVADYNTTYRSWTPIVQSVLESDSEEVFQCLFHEFVKEFTIPWAGARTSDATRAFAYNIVKTTAHRPDRERRLLLLWDKVKEYCRTVDFSRCLRYVAETCYSIPLAKALLCYGANLNSSPDGGSTYRTPLHRALRKSSPETAEMARFLLYRGANPEKISRKSKNQSIRDEIGAKEISKWLGMSWDELVAKVKADRDAGICPEEFM